MASNESSRPAAGGRFHEPDIQLVGGIDVGTGSSCVDGASLLSGMAEEEGADHEPKDDSENDADVERHDDEHQHVVQKDDDAGE